MPIQDKKLGKKIGDTLEELAKKLNYDCNNEEDIEISSEDFFEKYQLVIDGEKLTEAELKLVIECIRKLRK